MRRSRHVLAAVVVATALCADRASAAAPQVRPQVSQLARTVANKLTSSFRRVVKCTVILARRSDWPAMNEIYQSYWPDGDYPARTAFEAPLPHPDFLVEVECVAEVE